MPINHLLRSLADREPRSGDSRPTWLVELIDRAATLFEPLMGVSRVGFECWPETDHWVLFLYLGDTETIGGRDDGRLEPPEFKFDVLRLFDLLDEVTDSHWTVFPVPVDETGDDRSYLVVNATYQGHPVVLRVLSIAPGYAGPALRVFPNGDHQPA
tara:strand:- start:393 stop:860 length:468 start_codon:yes stop_codon:yes gene_type:complete